MPSAEAIMTRRRLDASRVLPHLWQGAYPEDLRLVRQAGFDFLVLCAVELQPERLPVRGLRCPIDDQFEVPLSPEEVAMVIDTAGEVARRVSQGERVLVTCAAGRNRSGLVTALAVHLLTGARAEACIAQVRRARGPLALSNPQFVQLIQRLARRRRR